MKSISLAFVLFVIYSSVEANSLGRILNGHIALGQFPWQVLIRVKAPALDPFCGGSLISDNFVLTAASCLKDASNIQVDIGSILFLFETYHSTQYQIHPEYNEQYQIHNIAVIQLSTSVTFRTNIQPILLPRISEQAETFVSTDSFISGFGVLEAGINVLSNQLRFSEETVIANEVCLQSFDNRFIESSVMCTSRHDGQSGCYGDRGSALVANLAGSWVQIGIASNIHANGCIDLTPSTYTRIGPYLEWIQGLTEITLRP